MVPSSLLPTLVSTSTAGSAMPPSSLTLSIESASYRHPPCTTTGSPRRSKRSRRRWIPPCNITKLVWRSSPLTCHQRVSASQASQSPTTGPTFRSTATASGCGRSKNTSPQRARVFSLTGWCRRSNAQPATSLLSPSRRASTSGRKTACRSTLRRWLVSTGAFLPRPRCSAIASSPRAPKRYRPLCSRASFARAASRSRVPAERSTPPCSGCLSLSGWSIRLIPRSSRPRPRSRSTSSSRAGYGAIRATPTTGAAPGRF